jgi:hypothetical protein
VNDLYLDVMRRWIVAGCVFLLLMFCGGIFAYKTYKGNRPAPMWVPLRINPQTPTEQADKLVTDLKAKLCTTAILKQVSQDLNLKKEWKLSSDEQAAQELGRRIFVRIGTQDTPMGRVPSLNVGVDGKAKERKLSGEIAMRLMVDVGRILGIKISS